MAQRKDTPLRYGQTKRLNLDIDLYTDSELRELMKDEAFPSVSALVRHLIHQSYLALKSETTVSERKKRELAVLDKEDHLTRVYELKKSLGDKIEMFSQLCWFIKCESPDNEMPNLAIEIEAIYLTGKESQMGQVGKMRPDRLDQIPGMVRELSRYSESVGMEIGWKDKSILVSPEIITNIGMYWEHVIRAQNASKGKKKESQEIDESESSDVRYERVWREVTEFKGKITFVGTDDPLYERFLQSGIRYKVRKTEIEPPEEIEEEATQG